jgi:serine/threonine protein phosphatase PrpC
MLRVAEHFEKSDTGRQRRVNEDAFFARSPLFVLADGMGGAQAGEVASRLAADTFAAGLPDAGTPEERLATQALEANRRIHEISRSREDRAGMGTTLTAAYVDADEIAIVHVGDSRAYLLRDGELTRLTRDHTLVDELVRRGKLTEAEAAEHPQRSIITRALGPEPVVEIDTLTYRAQADDVVLLCSDGLTSMIGEPEVAAILREAGSLSAAGRALVDAANEAGGRDNITVVLARLEDVAAGRAVAEAEAATAVAAAPAAPRAARPVRQGPLPRRVKLLAATVATLVVLGGLGIAGWLASRAVFFVGTNDRGLVTVYRGLPWDLPAGLHLYEQFYVSGVPALDVPGGRRTELLDHRLRSRNDASDLIAQLELGRLSP